jgi:hypothetical protein
MTAANQTWATSNGDLGSQGTVTRALLLRLAIISHNFAISGSITPIIGRKIKYRSGTVTTNFYVFFASDLKLFVNMVLLRFVGNVHVYLFKTTVHATNVYIRLFTLIHCCEGIG